MDGSAGDALLGRAAALGGGDGGGGADVGDGGDDGGGGVLAAPRCHTAGSLGTRTVSEARSQLLLPPSVPA